jgi:hypothetical protein
MLHFLPLSTQPQNTFSAKPRLNLSISSNNNGFLTRRTLNILKTITSSSTKPLISVILTKKTAMHGRAGCEG